MCLLLQVSASMQPTAGCLCKAATPSLGRNSHALALPGTSSMRHRGCTVTASAFILARWAPSSPSCQGVGSLPACQAAAAGESLLTQHAISKLACRPRVAHTPGCGWKWHPADPAAKVWILSEQVPCCPRVAHARLWLDVGPCLLSRHAGGSSEQAAPCVKWATTRQLRSERINDSERQAYST